jgi:hypothetical protein
VAGVNKSEKPKVTWFSAYKVLSRGKSPAIGKHPGWKSSILNIAVVAPIAIAFVGGNQIRMVSGAIPPDVPVVKAVGTFVQVTRGQSSYVAYVSEDGHVYNQERGTTIRDDKNLPQGIPPPKVYVEGFLRENGRGYFWPMTIRMADGKILLSSKQSMENYRKIKRRTYALTAFYVGLNLVLSLMSFCLISATKHRLISGE